MAELLTQLRAFHDGLEPARRRVLWVALVLALASVVGVGTWAASPTYVTLTVAPDPDDLDRVTQALSEAGVPYRVAGLTVKVKAEDEIEARRTAAGDGGIVGLEGLEQIDPWVTPFQEQLHRKRMIQGELVRTIQGLNGIRSAVVNLDLPPPSAFLRDAARPTAAVTLTPEPGSTLDARTAKSVAELVAHAVSGMTGNDVRVVDASTGRTLWAGEGSEATVENGQSAAAKEAALAAGVRAALTQVLGRPDASTVTVSVELETAAVQQTVSAVDPTSAVPATERIESETDTRGGTASGGVPGTDSNVPERPSNSSSSSSGTRQRETTQTTYQFTTTTTTTSTPAGAVRRLAAAVVVDSAVLAKVAAGGDEAQLKAQLEAAVRAALGASEKRGDEVVVSFLPFLTAEEQVVPEVTATALLTEGPLANAAVAALAVVLLFVFVVRPLVNAARPPTVAAAPTSPAVAVADEEDDADAPIDLTARLRGHVARLASHEPREVSDLVRKESGNSAEVVRRWLKTS